MSRSRRKTPAIGMTNAESDKPYKTEAHRNERRVVRARLASTADGDDRRLHGVRYGEPSGGPKDGKQWLGAGSPGRTKASRK